MLRSFTDDSPITYCFGMTTAPLIKINGDEIEYFKTLKEKVNALKTKKINDKFIIPWPGKWSTDVFNVSEADIILLLKEYS